MPSQPLHNSHSQTPTFFSFLSLFMVVASILLVLSGCSARNNDNASVVMAKPLTGKLTPLGTPSPSAERVTVGLYVINKGYSDLRHGHPRTMAKPKVVETTRHFHHEIADGSAPDSQRILHHPAAFDTTIDMLNAHPSAR